MAGRQPGGEQRDQPRSEQASDAVGGVEQRVGGGKSVPFADQRSQHALQGGAEHRLPDRQHDGKAEQGEGGDMAAQGPFQHREHEDQGADQISANHGGARLPAIRPASAEQRGCQHDRGAEGGQVAGPGAKQTDGNPDDGDDVELIADRGEREAAPEQGNGCISERRQDLHVVIQE